MRAEAERIGRDPDEIEYTVGGARGIEQAEEMSVLGVDRLVIAIHAKDIGEVRDELARFGDEVIAATRGRVERVAMGVLDGADRDRDWSGSGRRSRRRPGDRRPGREGRRARTNRLEVRRRGQRDCRSWR